MMQIRDIFLTARELRMLKRIRNGKVRSAHRVADELCDLGLADAGLYGSGKSVSVYRINANGIRYIHYHKQALSADHQAKLRSNIAIWISVVSLLVSAVQVIIAIITARNGA